MRDGRGPSPCPLLGVVEDRLRPHCRTAVLIVVDRTAADATIGILLTMTTVVDALATITTTVPTVVAVLAVVVVVVLVVVVISKANTAAR